VATAIAIATAITTGAESIPRRRVRWQQACRIVPTRYPAVNLFDRVADANDFDALYALEAMTNERLREELGHVERVPREERVFGTGSGPIMAAFTHVNVLGSRFSAGQFGVFYAARQRVTAVAETRYHQGRFLAATQEAAMHLPMRLYHVAIDAKLHDLRPQGAVPAAIYGPHDYGAAQTLGARLRTSGSAGVAYRSVRHEGGQCVGLFKPKGASACLHAAFLLYAWDGQRFSDVYEKTE
jgi:hypothetical protein